MSQTPQPDPTSDPSQMQPDDSPLDGGSEFPPRKRWKWTKRVWLPLGIVVVLLLTLRYVAARRAEQALQSEIAAIKAAGEPLEWRDFAKPPVPDEANAVELYKRAMAMPIKVPDKLELTDLAGIASMRRQYAAQVDEVLANAAPALDLCRKARALKQCDWKLDFSGQESSFHMQLPVLNPLRQLCRVEALAVMHALDAGDDSGAIERLRDTLAVARAPGNQPFLIGHLVHVACAALVATTVENVAPKLNVGQAGKAARPEQVKALIDELLDEQALCQGLLDAMYGERSFQYGIFERFRQGRSLKTVGVETEIDRFEGVLRVAAPHLLMEDELFMLRYQGKYVAAARQTNYPRAMSKRPQAPKFDGMFDRFQHAYSKSLLPVWGRVYDLHYRAVAMNRMAAAALAMRLCEAERGKRPAKLEELVGKYLPALPTDPFDVAGGAIRFKNDPQQPLLYCLGENGKDDEGDFVLSAKGRVDWDSSRDLVWFVNGDRPTAPVGGPPATAPASQPATAPQSNK